MELLRRAKMNKPRFLFGDIVVVNKSDIGVICKTWEKSDGKYEYEVYVRLANSIITFAEEDIDRYRVRHKYLSEEEMEWQWN
jgi:hypothetical protein